MIQNFWSQHGPRTAWMVTLGLAAIVAVYAVLVLTDTNNAADRVDDIAKQLRPDRSPAGGDGPNPRASNQQANAAVKRIRDRHLFMPAPPQGFRNVQGVLGDRVLYPGGQSFGVGENAMGATVIAIGTNWVELLHEDQTITLDIFRGEERGPELTRWDGGEAASDSTEERQEFRRSRGNAEGRSERWSRRRDFDR
ncbi:MAG: hypothetical protein AAF911_00770 [Planctomycetota bacterium]